ncbi:hypothetical protein IEG05_12355 [Pseudomonas kunmingensis]|nr:hypothetical protein [Stutzerimonas kunmingensis]
MRKLRLLLSKIITMLSKESPNLGYKTIIYPNPGQPIVIYDSLYHGQVASEQQLSEISKLWEVDKEFFDDMNTADLRYLAPEFGFPTLEVNPCTGLPMLNDAIDVAGNVYGMHYSEPDPL